MEHLKVWHLEIIFVNLEIIEFCEDGHRKMMKILVNIFKILDTNFISIKKHEMEITLNFLILKDGTLNFYILKKGTHPTLISR